MPTDAHRKRNKRYIETQDRIIVTVPKGARDAIKAHATQQNMSMNAYITKLIQSDMDCKLQDLAPKKDAE